MSVRQRIVELRAAPGTTAEVLAKAQRFGQSVLRVLDTAERTRRIERLQDAGHVGERPTDWQLWVAAHHMMMGFILPSNLEFYAAYGRNHTWAQVLRFLDDPCAVTDPIGLGITKEELISHLVQVVHTSAGYDVVLIAMFEDGMAQLRTELEALVSGTHPRQSGIDALVERPGYHAALLAALDRFEADPVGQWKVSTFEAPDGCEELYDWGIETFGSPGRLFEYALGLPESPGETIRAWWRGDLAVPSPR